MEALPSRLLLLLERGSGKAPGSSAPRVPLHLLLPRDNAMGVPPAPSLSPGRHPGGPTAPQDTPAEPQCFVLGLLVWGASPPAPAGSPGVLARILHPHPLLGGWEGTQLPNPPPFPGTPACHCPPVPSPPSITIQQILITTLQPPVLLFPGFAGPGSAELSSSSSKMPFKITREWTPLRSPCPRLPPLPWHPPRGQQHPCAMQGAGCHPPPLFKRRQAGLD